MGLVCRRPTIVFATFLAAALSGAVRVAGLQDRHQLHHVRYVSLESGMFELFFQHPLSVFRKGTFVLQSGWPVWLLVLLALAGAGGLLAWQHAAPAPWMSVVLAWAALGVCVAVALTGTLRQAAGVLQWDGQVLRLLRRSSHEEALVVVTEVRRAQVPSSKEAWDALASSIASASALSLSLKRPSIT